MKLRNKKTGKIVEAHEIDLIDNYVYLKIFRAGDYDTKQYNSLAELNEEWQDYEEPKEYWYIDWDGEVRCSDIHDERTEQMKLIGNYFETKEEAQKAVEKLKAWTRLKEKGFRFTGFKKIYQGRSSSPMNYTESPAYISFNKATEDFVSPIGNWVKGNWDDLQLVFGGEDDN